MAHEDRDRGGPSLEPPSFRLGRRRRRREPDGQQGTAPAAAPEPASPDDARTAPVPVSPSPGDTVPDAPADAQPTEVLAPAVAPGDRSRPTTTTDGEPGPSASARPASPDPGGATTDPRPLFADEVEPAAARRRSRRRAPSAPPATAASVEEPAGERAPLLGGPAASVFTGAFVGALVVGLGSASLRLCEVLRGTSSCGGSGIFLLLAILVVAALVGGALLRAFRVPDPASTSFLGVGLTTVVALLFLVEVLFAWWMVLVIPLCTAATFALSHWVSTTFVEPDDR